MVLLTDEVLHKAQAIEESFLFIMLGTIQAFVIALPGGHSKDNSYKKNVCGLNFIRIVEAMNAITTSSILV